MCGITARVARDDSVDTLLTCLENLEYRGYDSAGIAILNETGLSVTKTEGKVADLRTKLLTQSPHGTVGIGHTRWSTHGPPSDSNAHPHTDCSDRIAVIHNGIIDNHDDLREELIERGHVFSSDTDTEVLPHLVRERLDAGDSTEDAFRTAVSKLEGSYAVAMIVEGDKRVFASRQGSPLVLGLAEDARYLASDVPAFVEFTENVIYLEDGDIAIITPTDYRLTDASGEGIHRPVETIDWEAEAAEKGEHDHFMLKEILEQPFALRQTVKGRFHDGEIELEGFPEGTFTDVSSVQLVACGTSYHAAMYGEHLLTQWGIPASAHLASEYGTYPPPIDENTLVICVTQSGETADTLEALDVAKARGARTLALTNVVGSSAARDADDVLFIRAGPEIGVAATKTFSSQIVMLMFLADQITEDVTGEVTEGRTERVESVQSLSAHVDAVLDTTRAKQIGEEYLSEEGHFFIGRGNGVPVALEGALKFKEITYEHAEGFPAGELKHGPLALVTPETPVFAVCTGRDEQKLESAIQEVQTRGAPVVVIAPRNMTGLIDIADESLTVPATHPDLTPILTNVQLQLVAYHAASELGRSIDKPRNLAKSVTVE